MRKSLALLVLLAALAPGARAFSLNAKAMARFDVSYARCEVMFPEMRGRRDEVYLSMWRRKADEKARGELAAARKSERYQEERRRALSDSAKGEIDAAKLKEQCAALWGETQRQRSLEGAK